jgi:hypothetical protein
MIVCIRCGTPLEDDMRFCIECGEAVDLAPERASATAAAQGAAASGEGAAAQTASVAASGLAAPAATASLPPGGPASPVGANAMAAPDDSFLLRPRRAVSPQTALHRAGGAPVALLHSWRRTRWLKALTVFAVLCVVGASIRFGWRQHPASVRISGARTAPAPPHTTAVEIPLSVAGPRPDLHSQESADGAVTDPMPGGAGQEDPRPIASGVPPAKVLPTPSVVPPPAPVQPPQPPARQPLAAAAAAAEKVAVAGSPPGANTPGSAGSLVWTGRLRPGSVVTIEGDHASTGTLRGVLPGLPVVVESASPGIRLTEMPGPANGWKRIAFEGLREQNAVVTFHWRLF